MDKLSEDQTATIQEALQVTPRDDLVAMFQADIRRAMTGAALEQTDREFMALSALLRDQEANASHMAVVVGKHGYHGGRVFAGNRAYGTAKVRAAWEIIYGARH